MNRNKIISKSISYVLLVVMTYNFFCSAYCAVRADGCCGKIAKEQPDKCCNAHEKDSEEKKGDCQDMHLAFFKAVGQFCSEETEEATNKFHTFVANVTPYYTVYPISLNRDSIAYTGYLPPPPKADIRIFIQSFQI
jgi:hypothetical protein